jgi:hypothetical protein
MKKRRDFNRAYKMLPPKLRKTVQKRLMDEVFMVEHNQSFYRKKNGHEGITDYEWNGVQMFFQNLVLTQKQEKYVRPRSNHKSSKTGSYHGCW